ncbi:GNAT family N-acetyltransferase [Aeromicrobium terrae]|uniref:GNAT family N-acetyltransferase n=1 Tax=Aeromicrobium terrae TaxID=2498846 RepID=A0A5C8NHK7_9ACTN|nr:GNAT family N-acetyltransferase [Aeromicrobium terrae]TXL61299.1 GNAT family N-acetyltransferase [Aeromicrobium terrae]
MSDLLLRRARPDEAAAVGALTVAGYDANGYLVRPDGSRDHDYAAVLGDGATRADDAVVMVAVDADAPDTLLGTVTWCPEGSSLRELAVRDDQGEFRMLTVAPEARRRGVGAALLDWCVTEARSTGLREIVLSTLPEMTDAHRLYESRGFRHRPELDWEPLDGVVLWGFSLSL